MNNQTINDNNRDIIRYLNIHLNLFNLIFGILSATISDFITLNNLPVRQLFTQLYPEYHSIKLIFDWSNSPNQFILLKYSISTYDIIMCKIRTYLHMLSTDLSSGMLVFASINRFCFSYYRKKCHKNHFIEMCSYCIRCRNSIQHRIDNQLTSMIISEIIVTVFTSLPYGSYAFYHLLYGIQFQTTYKTKWISLFIRMSMYFEASCGFYIYLITLTTLRKRFCKIFIDKITSINFCC